MGLKEFFWSIAVKKGVKALVKGIIAWLLAQQGTEAMAKFGVTVDLQTLETSLTVAFFGGLEVLRNYLKQKLNLSFL